MPSLAIICWTLPLHVEFVHRPYYFFSVAKEMCISRGFSGRRAIYWYSLVPVPPVLCAGPARTGTCARLWSTMNKQTVIQACMRDWRQVRFDFVALSMIGKGCDSFLYLSMTCVCVRNTLKLSNRARKIDADQQGQSTTHAHAECDEWIWVWQMHNVMHTHTHHMHSHALSCASFLMGNV